MPSSDIVIRRALPGDGRAIRHFQQRIWLTTYQGDTITETDIRSRDFTSQQKIARMEQKLASDEWSGWAALVNEKLVGVVLANQTKNKIDILYVDPALQGQGLGRRLLRLAIDELDGNRPIQLQVAEQNSRAIAFYERAGFHLDKPVAHRRPTFPSGVDMPERLMILQGEKK